VTRRSPPPPEGSDAAEQEKKVARALERVVVVLDHPKDLVNIAGVVRVMMYFGLSRLRLVRPDEFDPWRIGGVAHRSEEITGAATLHDTLDEAVADATFVVGTTARARTAGRSYERPRQIAAHVARRTEEGLVAILFGREDRGLTNEALDRCHAVTIIPTDPEYPSINLAQAALLTAYEIFLAVGGGTEPLPKGRRATRPPTQEELEEAFAALGAGLAHLDFFKSRKPETVMRTLRTILSRAAPDLRETRLIGAIGHEIRHKIDRARAAGAVDDAGPHGSGGGGANKSL
jgi:TrmH family RNA methyltransferase